MHEMTRMMLLVLGLLHLPVAFAGDATEQDASAAARDSLLPAGQDLRFTRFLQQDTLLTSDAALESNLQVEFQDSSALGRIRKLRSLSLLTLAETEQSRLFLGMNSRGLFGVHFAYTRGNQSDRSLELARMPYLKSAKPAQAPARD